MTDNRKQGYIGYPYWAGRTSGKGRPNWHLYPVKDGLHVPFIGHDNHPGPYIRYRIVVLGLISGVGWPIWTLYQIQDGYHGTYIGYEEHTGPYIRLYKITLL